MRGFGSILHICSSRSVAREISLLFLQNLDDNKANAHPFEVVVTFKQTYVFESFQNAFVFNRANALNKVNTFKPFHHPDTQFLV